ncbi:hypothetical protein niasHT_038909 [Heterodera trifolii]|uniref:Uncharacterized protein n=1 Tax=Heterodera trifolii TaxID=157864 RepID=A0ABD2IMV8_9BILA
MFSNCQFSSNQSVHLTDGSGGFKEVQIHTLAQCHANNGSKETANKPYGIEFCLPREGGSCDDGILICYPAMLQRGDRLDTNRNSKFTRKFIVDAKVDNSLGKECVQNMPKNGRENFTIIWRGIKLRTMPKQNGQNNERIIILETSIASQKKYNLRSEQHKFCVLFASNQTAEPFTRFSSVENDLGGRALQNDFLRSNGPSFLVDYADLWLLGLDMLPMAHQTEEQREQLKMELFIHRSSKCFMEAWFIQPSDSIGPSDPKMPSAGQSNCPSKSVDQIFTTTFTNTEQQIISIEALTDANIKSVMVELLSTKKESANRTEVSFKIGTDIDFEVALPGSSKLMKSEGLRLARGFYLLNLDIVVINRRFKLKMSNKEFVANIHCFMIRLNGTQFGGLNCPTGDKLEWEAINRIKVQGQMLLFGIPIVKQMNNKMPFEGKSNFTSGIVSTVSDECNGEKMAYTLKMNDSRMVRGKKFDCSFAWLLERYKLSDKYAIKANTEKADLDSVCELEVRIFNFSQMVAGRVRHPKSYAWKIFVMADVLLEYGTVIWVDTSIFFASANLSSLLKPLQKGKIGPVQMPGFTSHGMNIATHPGMYEYLPLYTNFEPNKTYKLSGNNDPPQFESNFVILHKTEQTRQLMKWHNLNY